MIGLKRGTVKLVEHDTSWNGLFVEEKKLLKDNLGEDVQDVQHIGSTSINNIFAKPIIDIDLGIKDISLSNIEKINQILEKIGYEWRRQNSNPDHYLFVKGPDEKRTHYLHIVEFGKAIWKNDLFFRDYLNGNPETAEEYEKLKTTLAQKYPDDREKYTRGKREFFNKVLKQNH